MAKLITLAGLAEFLSKLPAFVENEGFIKNTVDNLTNYYKKTETYTQSEVDTLIAAARTGQFILVDALPEASADTMGAIYLVPKASAAEKNIKDEYITLDKGEGVDPRYVWEKIGDTQADLSNYYTKAEIDAKDTAFEEELVEVNNKLNNHTADITALQGNVASIEAEVAEVKADVSSLEAEVTALEAAVEGKVADVTLDGDSVVDASHIAVLESASNAEIDELFA